MTTSIPESARQIAAPSRTTRWRTFWSLLAPLPALMRTNESGRCIVQEFILIDTPYTIEVIAMLNIIIVSSASATPGAVRDVICASSTSTRLARSTPAMRARSPGVSSAHTETSLTLLRGRAAISVLPPPLTTSFGLVLAFRKLRVFH